MKVFTVSEGGNLTQRNIWADDCLQVGAGPALACCGTGSCMRWASLGGGSARCADRGSYLLVVAAAPACAGIPQGSALAARPCLTGGPLVLSPACCSPRRPTSALPRTSSVSGPGGGKCGTEVGRRCVRAGGRLAQTCHCVLMLVRCVYCKGPGPGEGGWLASAFGGCMPPPTHPPKKKLKKKPVPNLPLAAGGAYTLCENLELSDASCLRVRHSQASRRLVLLCASDFAVGPSERWLGTTRVLHSCAPFLHPCVWITPGPSPRRFLHCLCLSSCHANPAGIQQHGDCLQVRQAVQRKSGVHAHRRAVGAALQ